MKDIAALKTKLDGLKIEHASPNGNVNQTMAQFPDGVVVEFTGDPASRPLSPCTTSTSPPPSRRRSATGM